MPASKSLIFLLVCIVLGAGLRLFQLNVFPPGYTWDEAGTTYDAWAIATSGKDHWNVSYPLSFRSFGDYKALVLTYILAIVFKFIPVDPLAIRYVIAIFGVVLIPITYLIAYFLLGDRRTALLAALLIALNPWHIHVSRVGFEATLATTFFAIAIAAYIFAFKNKKYPILSLIFFVLSFYSYQSTKMVIPLTVTYLLFIYPFKRGFLLMLGLILAIIPFLLDISHGLVRATQTLLFFTPNFSWLTLGQNMIKTIHPKFLLLGQENTLRNVVPGFGILTGVELILAIAGIVFLKKQKSITLLTGIILISMIPSFVSVDSPHALRVMTILPFIQILGAKFLSTFHTRWVAPVIIIVMCITGWFGYYYTHTYVDLAAADFQYGYQEAVTLARKELRRADAIVFTTAYGQPYIYYLLFSHILPQDFIAGAATNTTFKPITSLDKPRTVYVGTPQEIFPDNPLVKAVVWYPKTATAAFVIAKTP